MRKRGQRSSSNRSVRGVAGNTLGGCEVNCKRSIIPCGEAHRYMYYTLLALHTRLGLFFSGRRTVSFTHEAVWILLASSTSSGLAKQPIYKSSPSHLARLENLFWAAGFGPFGACGTLSGLAKSGHLRMFAYCAWNWIRLSRASAVAHKVFKCSSARRAQRAVASPLCNISVSALGGNSSSFAPLASMITRSLLRYLLINEDNRPHQ